MKSPLEKIHNWVEMAEELISELEDVISVIKY